MSIDHVSDTARWVAVYRAMESERPDALFRDPWARRLAGEKGEAIVRGMRRGHQTAWAMIVRTAVFDEMILESVRERGVDLVLNLAAGLDTRPWRLDVPASLHWLDVDLPGIVDRKLEAMRAEQPRCRYEARRADLTDSAQRADVLSYAGGRAERTLVVSEGLLVYLDAPQVGALSDALHHEASLRWWLTDLASPRLLKLMQKYWGRQAGAGEAPFRFGPGDGPAFFQPHGWRELEWRSTGEEAHRLGREARGMWLWRLLGRLMSERRREEMKRMAGSLLLERE